MKEINIKLDNGKYEIKETTSGSLVALRHGEMWRDLCGDNLIYNMAYEIESLRAQLDDLTEVNSKWHDYAKNEGVRRQGEIKAAIDGLNPPAAKVPSIQSQLNEIITFIFDNEDQFLSDHCGHYENCELLEFYMASERCRFCVLAYDGTTITNTLLTSDILSWRQAMLSA